MAQHKANVANAALGQKVSSTKNTVKTGLSDAKKAVGAKVSALGSAVGASFDATKAAALNTYANAVSKIASGGSQGDINQKQVGGSSGGASHRRTRYISDIKNNRRRLYDREREIIQSIRNFEHNNRKESRHHKTRKLRNILMSQ